MSLQVSLGFHGNGREALEFYAKIFGFPMPQIMTYGEMPPDPAYPITARSNSSSCTPALRLWG